VVFLFTRPLVSLLARYRWFSRSGPTGFHGPDGGQPSTTAPPPAVRRRQSTVAAAAPAAETATVSMRKA